MSRQFRVFLLPSDVDALFEEFRRQLTMRILRDESPAAEPIELNSPVQDDPITSGDIRVRKFHRCYLTPDEAAHLDIHAIPRLGKWVIGTESEAIEFDGCKFDGVILFQGRFYYQGDVLIDRVVLPKRAMFTSWASKLFRIAKRNLRYDADLYAYIGTGAEEFRAQGGRFAAGIRPDGQIDV